MGVGSRGANGRCCSGACMHAAQSQLHACGAFPAAESRGGCPTVEHLGSSAIAHDGSSSSFLNTVLPAVMQGLLVRVTIGC